MGQLFRTDKRRQYAQMGFNDMFGRAHIGIEKVVTPAPGGIVAFDAVEADAAF